MNQFPDNIITVTSARGKLGDLTEQVSGEKYIIITKGGVPKAALVDVKFLKKLEDDVKKIYQKTYIDSTLLPFTRDFSDKEIDQWTKEDQL